MDKVEKGIREDIASLHAKMKGITAKAKDEKRALTEEEATQHEDFYNQIEAKKAEMARNQRERELEDELNAPAKPVEAVVKGEAAEDPRAVYAHTETIFRAVATRGPGAESAMQDAKKAQMELYKGGHYGGFMASVEAFNTLVDKDGGIFLPTTISDRIMEIEREFGAFPANSLRIPLTVGGGRQIVPNMLGDITFHAANQGSEVRASRFSFKGLALEELKWMAWVPWTNEMGSAAGQRLVELIMRKLGEASARVKDTAAISANGTSTYHNLTGLLARSASADFPEVRLSTAATGHTSFGSIDEDDFNAARLDIAPSIRTRGIYILHPDWEIRLAQIKDGEKRPLYLSGGAISNVGGNWTIWGKRVVFTEAAPNTDGTSEAYGIFYVPDYFAFGDVGAFSAEQFDQATILDENGANINLASQDMRALRIKEFFDYELSGLTVSSGGNTLGAFTVLQTAAT